MWKFAIVLKDGTRFIGKVTLGCIWRSGFGERRYKVVDALSSSIPVNIEVVVPWHSISYFYPVR